MYLWILNLLFASLSFSIATLFSPYFFCMTGRTAELMQLTALLAIRRGRDHPVALRLLRDALESCVKAADGLVL